MKRVIGWTLSTTAVLILIIGGAAGWLLGTENGLRWLVGTAERYAPGELRIEHISGRLAGPLAADGLLYRDGDLRIAVQTIRFDWTATALLRGALDIGHLEATGIDVKLPAGDDERPAAPVDLPDLRLPLTVNVDLLTVRDITLVTGAQPPVKVDRIHLVSRTRFDRIQIDVLEIVMPEFAVTVAGSLAPYGNYRHDLTVAWHVTPPDLEAFNGKGTIEGDVRATHVVQHLRAPFTAELDITAKQLLDGPDWQGSVRIEQLALRRINPDWPPLQAGLSVSGSGTAAVFEVSGDVTARYDRWNRIDGRFGIARNEDGTVRIKRLDLAADGLPTTISATGMWRPGQDFGHLTADIRWTQLVWPLDEPATVHSANGTLNIDGQPDDYTFRLAADIAGEQLPDTQIRVAGSGNLQRMQLAEIDAALLDGNVNGSADLSWDPQLHWNAKLSGRGLNPGAYTAQWPGSLAFALDTDGRMDDKGLQASATLDDMSGTLRRRPVSLGARLELEGDTLAIRDAALTSGDSRIAVDGTVGETLDLDWSVDSPDLLDLYPALTGSLHVAGSITGDRTAPLLAVDLRGSEIAYAGNSVDHVQATASVELFDWIARDIRLTAGNLRAGETTVETLHIEGAGTPQANQVSLSIVLPTVTTVANVTARHRAELDEGQRNEQWNITLDKLDLVTAVSGSWELTDVPTITVADDTLAMPQICWAAVEQDSGQACIEVHRQQTAWQIDALIDDLPLQPFTAFLPQDPEWKGTAHGRLHAEYNSDAGMTGELRLRLGAGSIRYALFEGEHGSWDYRDAELVATLNDAGLTAHAGLRMDSRDEYLEARLAMPEFDPLTFEPAAQTLDGHLEVKLSRTGLVEVLVTEIQETRGDIALVFDVEGTVADPQIRGRLTLDNGGFRVPQLGIQVEDFTVTGETRGLDRFDFRVSGRSGDGTLNITGHTRLEPENGWPTELEVRGEEVQVAQIPEARVLASPDINVRIANREVHIEGRLHIPYARLQPRDVSTATTVSEDVVIVGESATPPEERWKIHTQVRVILGDRVALNGFGFEGRIEGNLLLTDRPGEVTTASGELSVAEGRYRAYGQRLTVERGLLLFTGGPVSNPGLDLRAVRHIEADNVTVGVRVLGTLRTPRFELFSNPAMGDTEVLSYLVLGRPLEGASSEEGQLVAQAALVLGLKGGDFLARSLGDRFGLDEMRIETADTGDQAALVIGRYLSPRLYVSYGVGLIEAVNTFRLRYRVSDRWELRAESGIHQSTDAVFTIER